MVEPGAVSGVADNRLRIPWYLLVAVVLLPVLFSTLVLVISLRTNERAVAAERMSRRVSELAMCQLVVLLDDTYKQTPPPSETGRQVALAMANLRVANHCP